MDLCIYKTIKSADVLAKYMHHMLENNHKYDYSVTTKNLRCTNLTK